MRRISLLEICLPLLSPHDDEHDDDDDDGDVGDDDDVISSGPLPSNQVQNTEDLAAI